MRTKYSYGLGICRINFKNEVTILCCRRRVSYEFIDFVKGHYPIDENLKTLLRFFERMSYEEKQIVLTFDFNKIWEHAYDKIFLNKDFSFSQEYIDNCYNKFNKVVLPNKELIEQKIKNSYNYELIWDLPKGRMEEGESTYETAIRETVEEVNITPKDYKFLDLNPVVVDYVENNTRYVLTFYIVEYNSYNNNYMPDNKEVTQVKWISENNLKNINGSIKSSITRVLMKYKRYKNDNMNNFSEKNKNFNYSQLNEIKKQFKIIRNPFNEKNIFISQQSC